jgi:hypothetical protein
LHGILVVDEENGRGVGHGTKTKARRSFSLL